MEPNGVNSYISRLYNINDIWMIFFFKVGIFLSEPILWMIMSHLLYQTVFKVSKGKYLFLKIIIFIVTQKKYDAIQYSIKHNIIKN